MAWIRCEQTDRQGDSYIPPNFVCRGYKTLFVGGIETLLGEGGGGYNKIDFVGHIKITYLHVLIPSKKSDRVVLEQTTIFLIDHVDPDINYLDFLHFCLNGLSSNPVLSSLNSCL